MGWQNCKRGVGIRDPEEGARYGINKGMGYECGKRGSRKCKRTEVY